MSKTTQNELLTVKTLVIQDQPYKLIDEDAARLTDIQKMKNDFDAQNPKVAKYSYAWNFGNSLCNISNNGATFGVENSVEASGGNSIVAGAYSWSSGVQSLVMGANNVNGVGCAQSLLVGYGLLNQQTTNGARRAIFGVYNNVPDKAQLIIGNGTSTARSNSFYVESNGNATLAGSLKSSGADYAEYFEWADGNLFNEDRIGKFITLVNGNKIKIASNGDEILGVISAIAAVTGDSYEDRWQGRYVTDVFGRIIYEDVEVEYKTDVDENGQPIVEKVMEKHPKLNPNYNPEEVYIPRSERPEWACVGLLGKVVLIDDGTCEPGGKCTCAADGTATMALEGYHVLRRLDDSHILILLK